MHLIQTQHPSVLYDPLTGYFYKRSNRPPNALVRADNPNGKTTTILRHSASRLAWKACFPNTSLDGFHQVKRLHGYALNIRNLSLVQIRGNEPAILGRTYCDQSQEEVPCHTNTLK